MSDTAPAPVAKLLPFIVGGSFIVLFVVAGIWQLNRAEEKRAERDAFSRQASYTSFADGNTLRPYERIKVRGRWLEDRQIILDNIIVDSRLGHYVLTPLETAADEPLLIVNRGFLPQTEGGIHAADIAVSGDARQLRGRVGRLPRAGYRMGAAIPEVSGWPVHAVYPDYEDIELTLDREIQSFVLLLDAAEPGGFGRDWQPEGIGPGRHLAYAVQWFAMTAVLAGLLAWHAYRGSFANE